MLVVSYAAHVLFQIEKHVRLVLSNPVRSLLCSQCLVLNFPAGLDVEMDVLAAKTNITTK